jgi:hypothetical protein
MKAKNQPSKQGIPTANSKRVDLEFCLFSEVILATHQFR